MGRGSFGIGLAMRTLRRSPRFTLVSVLILALGIGVTTAVYSVFYGVLIKPLAFPESEELVRLWPGTHVDKMIADHLSEDIDSLEVVTAYQTVRVPISGSSGSAEVVRAARVGVDHFRVLGAEPVLGRAFRKSESRPGESRVVILGNGLWHRRYGAAETTLGTELRIDGVDHSIIGVMPAELQSLEPGVQLWLPMEIDPSNEKDYLGSFYLTAVGRLAPGATVQQAASEVQRLIQNLRSTYPNLITDELVAAAGAVPLKESLVGGLRSTLLLLQAIVVLVLLVACGNMANLVRTRVVGRGRELAIRAAMGAGRRHLLEIVVLEVLVIVVIGALAGLAVGWLLLEAFRHTLGTVLPQGTSWSMGPNVIVVGLALAAVSGLVVAVFSIRGALGFSLQEELRESTGAASAGRAKRRARWALVVAQVAMASLLLVASGLLLRSWDRLQRVDPGFESEDLVTFRVDLPKAQFSEQVQMNRFYDELLRELERIPGVTSVGGVHLLPLSPDNWSFPYVAEGHEVNAATGAAVSLPMANFRIATPGYFRTMGIDLVTGRTFDSRDSAGGSGVGLINRSLAEELWGVQESVGREIQLFGQGGPTFRVVGVVGDVSDQRLDAPPKPTIYRPYTQWPVPSMHLFVQSDVEPMSLASTLRTRVDEVGSGVPVDSVRPVSEVVDESTATQRVISFLAGAFAVLAFLLALSGLYAVNSYAVVQRTREFGVRLAMGATRRQVLAQVLREGLSLSVVGILLGLALALAASRFLQSHLYATSPLDLGVYGVVAGVVVAASILSVLGPASRAMGTDPMAPLRYE